MIKKPRRNDPREDRAQWLNYTPRPIAEKSGKKRFFVHKNIDSDSILIKNHESKSKKPKNSNNPAKISTNARKKSDAGVQVFSEKLVKLEEELTKRNYEISVLSNMYDLASRRLEEMTKNQNSKTRTSSIVDQNILSPENFIDSRPMRTSSLPSIKPFKLSSPQNVALFNQPKFTKSRPKIIFTNPITGVVPFTNFST